MPRTILCDVDGVLADFVDGVQNITSQLGIPFHPPTEWDIFKTYSEPDRQAINNHLNRPGFAVGLLPYPDAQDGIASLRREGFHIVFVTSPWRTSETWAHDRNEWLRIYFDAEFRDVIHANRKDLIHGETLIDDKPSNCRDWSVAHGRPALLFDQPYNQGNVDPAIRVSRWTEIIDAITKQTPSHI